MHACARISRTSILLRHVVGVILALLLLAPMAVSAQRTAEFDRDLIERTVLEIARLQERGNSDELYDWLTVAARDRLSRSAFTAWLADPDRFQPEGDPELVDIQRGDYRWPVTGITYPNVVRVTVEQPGTRNGEAGVETITYPLQFDGERWRWMFDDIADVADQEVPTLSYASGYRQGVYEDVDLFWARVFETQGEDYAPVMDVVGITELPYQTACGVVSDIDSAGIYLCLIDATIYYSPRLKAYIDEQHGPMGWHTIIAHEWAHQVQSQLGIRYAEDPELGEGAYILELEVQADCMTGIYMQDAVARGAIDKTDLQEARTVLATYGDLEATQWDNDVAHGTGDQRVASFNTGYTEGFVGCGLDLDSWNT